MTGPLLHGVVVAAGSGSRFDNARPKQLVALRGRTILERAVGALRAGASFETIVVVTRSDLLERVAAILGDSATRVVEGGATRGDSVRAGLRALSAGDDELVLVHDAARPLVAAGDVAAVAAALQHADGATLAVRSADTILEVAADLSVIAVPDRRSFYRAQTPQGFRIGVLRGAYRAAGEAGFAATDDCGVVARFAPEARIAVVPGSERNIKITTPADIVVAERILSGDD